MNSADINPYIRFFWTRKVGDDYSEMLWAYDFRLFYCVSGAFIIETEDASFEVVKNTLAIIPPATPYLLKCHPQYGDDHLFCIFNFDMNSRQSDHKMSIRPQPERFFRKEQIISLETTSELARPTVLEGDHSTLDMIKEIEHLFTERPKLYREESGAILKRILTRGLRNIDENTAEPGEIGEITAFIRSHYREPISNISIAKQFKYHPNHLNRIFKAHMGTSLHSYVISYRLKIAKELLIGTDCRVEEVARMSGFDSPSYFSKYFKAEIGLSPTDFRGGKQAHKQTNKVKGS